MREALGRDKNGLEFVGNDSEIRISLCAPVEASDSVTQQSEAPAPTGPAEAVRSNFPSLPELPADSKFIAAIVADFHNYPVGLRGGGGRRALVVRMANSDHESLRKSVR